MREKLELKWAPDSLFQDPIRDTVEISDSSGSIALPPTDENKNQVLQESKENSEDEIEPVQNIAEKIKDDEKVIAFTEPKAITLDQAYKLYNDNVLIIDARDESDFLEGHITNSVNIPFDDLDNHKQKLELISKENPLVVYCAGTGCDLSILLGNLLFEQGYKQVYVFFGGWIEWSDAGYPVEHSSESNSK